MPSYHLHTELRCFAATATTAASAKAAITAVADESPPLEGDIVRAVTPSLGGYLLYRVSLTPSTSCFRCSCLIWTG
jgi:hypothetical protein